MNETKTTADAVEVPRIPPPLPRTGDPAPAKLSRRLRGDLDLIVLKALRKEPQRRYVSVEQMAEDIRRHLQALPIAAAPDSIAYRARKFVRRHRAALCVDSTLAGLAHSSNAIEGWQHNVSFDFASNHPYHREFRREVSPWLLTRSPPRLSAIRSSPSSKPFHHSNSSPRLNFRVWPYK